MKTPRTTKEAGMECVVLKRSAVFLMLPLSQRPGVPQASNSDVKAKLRRPPREIQGKADKRSYAKRLLFQIMSFKSLLESCGFFKSKGLFCFLTVFSFRGTGSHASKAHGYTPPSQERHLQRTTELGAFTGFIKHRDK